MPSTDADELMRLLPHMTAEEKAEIDTLLTDGLPRWLEQVGPQMAALDNPADILFYGGQAGGGKALALDTPLPTPDGWTTMGAVAVGDALFDEQGRPCRVVAKSPVMIGRECYRVVFSDGAELVADAEHRWLTTTEAERDANMRRSPEWRAKRRAGRGRTGSGKRPDVAAKNSAAAGKELPQTSGSVRTTRDIADSLLSGRGALNHAVDVAEPLRIAAARLPIDPYLLGAWLGDGTSAGARMTMAEPAMVELVSASCASSGWHVTQGSTPLDYGVVGGLKMALVQAGLVRNKHIPAMYLRASEDQRLALLQGLMDTDGHADQRGQCEFTTTSEALAFGAIELVRSLGIKATICVGRATLNGRDCGPKYRIKFVSAMPVFRLQRKLDRQKRTDLRSTTRRRYIERVEPIASVPVQCLAVDSQRHLFLAGHEMVPTHNTDLVLGLALTQHEKSIIFRREAVQLVGLEERMTAIMGTRAGYNSQDQIWRLPEGRTLEFGSCKEPDDWLKYQGRPHDLKAFDEITHFLEIQFRALIGWKRTDNPKVRQRVVCAGNPPTSSDGEWVIRFWAPWLDPTHPNPAKDGELRWFVTDEAGKDMEVPGPAPVMVGTELMKPSSRTFIRSSVDDNLFLTLTGYKATLQSLPEPLRSQMLRGDFMAGRTDPVWQTIPTEWIRAAQLRWTPRDVKGPMTAMGLDPARGGIDKTAAARRHGQWFDEIVQAPGVVTKDGPTAAAFAAPLVRNGAPIAVDAIGIGSSALDFIKGLGLRVHPVVASEGSKARDKTGTLRFKNVRAEMYWRMREALDPTADEPIALPNDSELLADLAAVRFKVVQMGQALAGIQMRDKDEIRELLGRSPDKGDAVAMTFVDGLPVAGITDDATAYRRARGLDDE